MIAALFVDERGPYVGLDGVDAWGETRDARLYAGPWPVVAHPPCERWGRYASGGPSAKFKRTPGEDGGCFAAALAAVRRWGGVLEHPAGSAAWRAFDLNRPTHGSGWTSADLFGGFTCLVDQGNYGHRAQKPTWLYAKSLRLPSLDWSRATEGRPPNGALELMSKKQRRLTPGPFRDILIEIARFARVEVAS
jgi:hypothetical protein